MSGIKKNLNLVLTNGDRILIMLLAKHGYPPITKDEVFKEIFEQAENFKKYREQYRWKN